MCECGVSTELDERLCHDFGGDGEGSIVGEFAVVECGEEDIAWVTDDVDCFACVVEFGVLVGELVVCFDVGWSLWVEVGWHFAMDVLDFCGDICGVFGWAVDCGVEHEAEPGVAALWVGCDPDCAHGSCLGFMWGCTIASRGYGMRLGLCWCRGADRRVGRRVFGRGGFGVGIG